MNHIDDHAIEALSVYYEQNLPRHSGDIGPRILDLCSSWVSHIPPQIDGGIVQVTGIGMNEGELGENPILERWLVHDLNANPHFQRNLTSARPGKASSPFAQSKPSDRFDAVICNVSIDYLTRPLEVLEEVAGGDDTWIIRTYGDFQSMFPNKGER